MDTLVPARALISVSDKSDILDLARFLQDQDVEILSTGGTASVLKDGGIDVKDVSIFTGQAEIMDGRVKTLHPNVHGAILAKRDDPDHLAALFNLGVGPIDLVVVNLYPFRQTVASGRSSEECIEQIDIGGPAMIRAAAKNHESVAVVTSPSDYNVVRTSVETLGGINRDLRQRLACRAFEHTAAYDAAIARWFQQQLDLPHPANLILSGTLREALRYGENPQQTASFYVTGDHRPGVATAVQLQGKALSYNNLNDTDAAFELVAEFSNPAIAIIKHVNPCGVATADTLERAFDRARACDPASAFGGIVACNQEVDESIARQIADIFFEVVIAPAFTDEAQAVLLRKKNLRVLRTAGMPPRVDRTPLIRTISGGFLVQSRDQAPISTKDARVVTKRAPNTAELADLEFAMQVCRHVKSNAIVLARGGATVGIGAGQMSRVDAVDAAIRKAAQFERPEKSVLASDAFFPFADGLEAAVRQGITAVIQPGGSVRDAEVIEAADEAGIAMIFTGTRYFRH